MVACSLVTHCNIDNDFIQTIILNLISGVLVGGLLFASLADWHGRRQILMFFLGFGSVFSFASSLAQDFAQFAAFRFFTGVG